MKKILLIILFYGRLLNNYAQTAGYTKVDVAVGDNGEAMASIPLNLPKGTILQPSLSFSYSSQGNNGLQGLGFSLSGIFQTVTRVPSTLAQDGQIDPVDFNALDRFALNGERLVLISGIYGADNSEYRTEQNSFAKIIALGNTGAGPEKFQVFTKDGLQFEFGYTTDSRIEAVSATGATTKPLLWLLNKIQDNKGNYLTISYTEENTSGKSEFRPSEINYTGNNNTGLAPYNKVKFIYELRLDRTSKILMGGYFSQITNRLKTVEVTDHSQIHRRYELEYDQNYRVSKLKKVTEYGLDNVTALPPTLINWIPEVTTKAFNKTGSGTWTVTNGNSNRPGTPFYHREGDFNGDGKIDFITYSYDLGIKRCFSTGSSFDGLDTPLDGSTSNYDKPAFGSISFFGDFDGNGTTDMGTSAYYQEGDCGGGGGGSAGPNANNTFDCITGYRFLGYTYVNGILRQMPVLWDITSPPDSFFPTLTGDFNGDGKSDILISSSNTLISTNGIAISDPSFLPQNALDKRLADFNGDGRTDIAQAFTSGSTKIWRVGLSTGTSFNFQTWVGGPTTDLDKIQSGDFNGDGMTDFMIPNLDGTTGSGGTWQIYISSGTSFNRQDVSGPNYGRATTSKHFAIDINGDGLTDLVGYNPTDKINVCLSTGNVGQGGINATLPMFQMLSQTTNFDNPIFGDFDGDGKNDWGRQVNATQWEVNLNNIPKEFVESTINGHGTMVKFEYAPITNNNVYSKGTTSSYPNMDFQGAFHVVKKLSVENGIGSFHETHYKYGGAILNHLGRGFRGFSKRTITDSTAKQFTTNTYNRDFRLINSSLIKSEQRTFNNKLVRLIENTPDTTKVGSVYFSFTKTSKDSQYELNGLKNKSKQTDFIYDVYGNPTKITEIDNDGYQIVTDNTYTNFLSSWRLGRLTATIVTKSKTGSPSIVKNSAFSYDANGHLIQEILLPTSNRKVQKDYVLDGFGNTLSLTTSGNDIVSRTESSIYDADGRNVITAKNALNHPTSFSYNRGFLISTTDPNGLIKSVLRDFIGREILTTMPDATTHNISYKLCNGYAGCPTLAVHYTEEQITGSGLVRTYFDKIDRVIRTEKQGFDGSKILTDKQFNSIGLVVSQSDPYYSGNTPQWTTTEYDSLQRPIKIIQPGNRITKTIYSTFSYGTYNVPYLKVINPKNQRKEQAINPQGKVLFTKDHNGSLLNNSYDSDLNLIRVNHAQGNQIEAQYDIRGYKIFMQDLDMGQYSYEYNTLGLLTSQTNPKGQIPTFEYDKLNRITKRIEPEGTTLYEYDDAINGIGKPSKVKFNNQIIEEYLYDSKGRPIKTIYNRETKSYQAQFGYNTTTGFLETKTYPNGLAIKYLYNIYGYLKEVRNNDASNKLYWKANILNARDMITSSDLGNGLKTKKTYNEVFWDLTNIETGTASTPQSVQNSEFQFDLIGNLQLRREFKGAGFTNYFQESFDYDSLNRVSNIGTGYYNSSSPAAWSGIVTTNYDFLGNITSKSDVGTYNYGEGGVGPHVLTSINNLNSPNICVFPFNQKIQYTSYNYVSLLANNRGDSIKLNYGPNRERITQTLIKGGKQSWKKHYVGGIFEKIYYPNTGNDFLEICYIEAAGQVIAYIEKTSKNTTTTRYLHTDHLGSATVITKEDGSIDKRFSYDAWGRQRDPETWKNYAAPPDLPTNQRGFTFHEMLDLDWLICMNARVYDPISGRFLSPDTFVQDPDDLQCYNRYGYVNNNPLSYTDPTGHFSLKSFVSGVFKIAVGLAALSVGQAWLVGVLGNSFLASAIISGATFGFGVAYVNTVISGGSLGDAFRNGLQSGFWAGVNAGITYGIGHPLFGDGGVLEAYKMYKPVVHGIAQGTLSVIRGGDFKSQFMSGIISNSVDGLGFASKIVVGGAASKLSGGNFANGAISAAFIQLFNDDGEAPKSSFNKFVSGLTNNTYYKAITGAITVIGGAVKGLDPVSNMADGLEAIDITNNFKDSNERATELLKVGVKNRIPIVAATETLINLSIKAAGDFKELGGVNQTMRYNFYNTCNAGGGYNCERFLK